MLVRSLSEYQFMLAIVLSLLINFLLMPVTTAADEGTRDSELFAELKADWNKIFPSGNRNAGGAMFFKHILDNYKDEDEFFALNRFYCPVSGSTVDPSSEPEFVLSLIHI